MSVTLQKSTEPSAETGDNAQVRVAWPFTTYGTLSTSLQGTPDACRAWIVRSRTAKYFAIVADRERPVTLGRKGGIKVEAPLELLPGPPAHDPSNTARRKMEVSPGGVRIGIYAPLQPGRRIVKFVSLYLGHSGK